MGVVFRWRGVDACHFNSHFADEETRETKLKPAGSLPGYAAIAGERDFITRRGELSSAADVFRVQGGADRHLIIQAPGRHLRGGEFTPGPAAALGCRVENTDGGEHCQAPRDFRPPTAPRRSVPFFTVNVLKIP